MYYYALRKTVCIKEIRLNDIESLCWWLSTRAYLRLKNSFERCIRFLASLNHTGNLKEKKVIDKRKKLKSICKTFKSPRQTKNPYFIPSTLNFLFALPFSQSQNSITEISKDFVCLFVLRLNVPVINFSVMSGWSHYFRGITSTFWE